MTAHLILTVTRPWRPVHAMLAACVCLFMQGGPAARGQIVECATGQWQASLGMPGFTNFGVQAICRWPAPGADASEPAALAVGGTFTGLGGMTVNRIARWNGSTWSALGSGMGGNTSGVYAVAVAPNGDLIAGGDFTTAGGVVCNGIARWNGTSWQRLGSGMAPSGPGGVFCVYALAVLPNGDIVAGGIFPYAGGLRVNGLARWNGTSWAPFGTNNATQADELERLTQ